MNNVAAYTYISLFTGAAGLDNGLRIAFPSSRCLCYVEREGACAEILAARITDGSLDDAPIWSDVRTFPSELFRGRVGGVIGGFPCQDMSVAGRGDGIIDGDRSALWWDFLKIIRNTEAKWAFIENVPGLLNAPSGDMESDESGAGEPTGWTFRNIDAVLGPLSEIGFDAEWICLPASGVGASHKRERVFILAYRPGTRFRWREDAGAGRGDEATDGRRSVEPAGDRVLLEHAERARRPEARSGYTFDSGSQPESGSGAMVHPEHPERGTCEQLPGHGESRLDRSRKASSRAGDGEPILGTAATVEHTSRRGQRKPWEPSGSAGLPHRTDTVVEDAARNGERGRVGENGRLGRRGVRQGHHDVAESAEPGLAQRGDQAGDGGKAHGIASTERAGGEVADVGCEHLFIQQREVWGESSRSLNLSLDHIPGPGLGAAGVVDDIRELLRRNPRRAWERYQAEIRNTIAWADLLVRYPWLQPAISQEEVESALRGGLDELADLVVEHRTAALRAVGNGVHSYQAAVAFTELVRRVR